MAETIEFVAEVVRVKTMADGGLRFEFGVGESYIMQAAQLMECKRAGAALRIVATPVVTDCYDETKEGAARSSTRVGRRRLTKRRDQSPSG